MSKPAGQAQISEQSTVSGQHLCPVVTERNEERGGKAKGTDEREKSEKNREGGKKKQGRRADVMIVCVSVSSQTLMVFPSRLVEMKCPESQHLFTTASGKPLEIHHVTQTTSSTHTLQPTYYIHSM